MTHKRKKKDKGLRKKKRKNIDNCFSPESTDWIIVNDTKSKCLDAIDKDCINVKACKKCGSDNWTQWIRGEECTSHRDLILRLKMNCLVRQNGTCDPDVDGQSTTADGGRSTTADGGRSTTADGGRSTTADGGRSTTADGGRSTTADGGRSTTADGGRSSTADGGRSTTADGGRSSTADGGRSTTADGGRSRPTTADGGRSTTADGGRSTTADGITTGGLQGGEIAGITVGIAILIALVAILICLVKKRRRKRRSRPNIESSSIDGADNPNTVLAIGPPVESSDMHHSAQQTRKDSHKYQGINGQPNSPAESEYQEIVPIDGIGGQFRILPSAPSGNSDNRDSITISRPDIIPDKEHPRCQDDLESNTYNALWQGPGTETSSLTSNYYGSLKGDISTGVSSNDAEGYFVLEDVPHNQQVAGMTPSVGAQNQADDGANTYNTLWQDPLNHATGMTPDHYGTLNDENSTTATSDQADAYFVLENASGGEHVAQKSTIAAQRHTDDGGNTYNTLWHNPQSHATGMTQNYYATLDDGNSAVAPSDEIEGYVVLENNNSVSNS